MDVEPVVLDVTEAGPWPALPQVESVAWCVGFDRGAGRSMREVYVEGLERFVTRVTSGRLLYAGSTSVYGAVPRDEASEDSPTAPISDSGHIALEAESILTRLRPAAVRFRLAGIHGPGRVIGESSLRAGRILEGTPDAWLNLIHVDDAARAFVAAGDHAAPGTLYNVADGRPVRRLEYYQRLAIRLGTSPPRFADPAAGGGPGRRIVSRRVWAELGLEPPAPAAP